MKLVIRPHLDRLGHTQQWLADQLEVNKSTISSLISGRMNPSFEMLTRLIEALGVAAGDVLVPDDPGATVPGFSDDAAPYRPAGAAGEAIEHLARRARHPMIYRIARAMPGFGLRAGDVVVADLNRAFATGDLVIANAIDGPGGRTLVRRVVDRHLVSDDPRGELLEIGQEAAVLAVILGEVRPTEDVA